MLLIALTFLYIVFTTINFGACVNSLFKTRNPDFAITSLLGIFSIALLTSVWAIFDRVNWEFHMVLFLGNTALFFVFKNAVIANYRLLRIRFTKLSKPLKWLLLVNSILILAKSAAAPYILDNESYYIQTVKWLNEYGFVEGLANLHLFLGQMSGWHVAQSAFSFSFIHSGFNDLSGYCLLLTNLYAVFRLQDYFQSPSKIALVMGLLPIANVFFLQFSGAPSADIPIFVLTFLAIDIFICHFENPERGTLSLLVILVLFALYIKITAIALVILPLFWLVLDFKILFSKRIFFLSFGVLALFVTRNAIVSGMPLFPLPYAFGFHPDYAIPQPIVDFFFVESRPYLYGLTKTEFDAMPVWEIFIRWMRMPKLHGFFNTVNAVLLVVTPFFIRKFAPIKSVWIVYLTMVAQFALLFWLSPQYRFFMNFILFFGLFCLACLVNKQAAVKGILVFSTVLAAVPVFVPLGLDSVTNNKYADKTMAFSARELVFPHPNSKSDTGFEKLKIGNLDYYSPVNNDFFWKTGDGPLPCVNKDQIEFFDENFHARPQLRSDSLQDGFLSEFSHATIRDTLHPR
ncbi:hypothetical protein HUK80_00390 [Flavobacterium sp. MAH-1]|uniref:DUF8201 domain-containing protein n=1 Tax=Flavobacterium agri TaxID=2743471 RepID=A0A7Y8XYN0_9FLAO|nr:hypothetical protein [Flavobacterium agri]NUY79335.1 hypothetical protein [Flavobacterium agri]NYA69359.1 hypothetical protein [Flavobacterium agri]